MELIMNIFKMQKIMIDYTQVQENLILSIGINKVYYIEDQNMKYNNTIIIILNINNALLIKMKRNTMQNIFFKDYMNLICILIKKKH